MNQRGESIAETLIALTILAIGITISSTIVSRATRNMATSENRIVALNIAREGLEGVRNMRDSNWLKFSNNLRQCWNHQAGANGSGGDLIDDTCDGSDPLIPGDYIFYKNDEFGWKASPALLGPNDATPLFYMDIDNSVDTDGDGDPLNDEDILNHDHDLTEHGDSLGDLLSQSPFSRRIVIEYLENSPDTSTPPSSQSSPEDSINTNGEWLALGLGVSELNRWRVTSIVTWNDRGGIPRKVELQTILTDHFGRTNLTD